MRLLLDTHTFIWFVTDSPRISVTVKELIEDENNEKLLNTASIGEMAIKQSTGKLSFGQPFKVFIDQQFNNLNSIDLLKINLDHIAQVATLPLHHCDPFARLLIA
jgi:PIN domain nuclease of toxin-antitoxin system